MDTNDEIYVLFIALDEGDHFEIGKIEFNDKNSGYQFTVRPCINPLESNLTSQQKVAIQAEFLTLLYDAVDEIKSIQGFQT